MSESSPEPEALRHGETTDLSESKSLTGSAEVIGWAPGEDYVAPMMALDSLEPLHGDE